MENWPGQPSGLRELFERISDETASLADIWDAETRDIVISDLATKLYVYRSTRDRIEAGGDEMANIEEFKLSAAWQWEAAVEAGKILNLSPETLKRLLAAAAIN